MNTEATALLLSEFVQPPLVGRKGELESLQNYLEQTLAGRGVVAFIKGEAGLGKTRLAEEFGKMAVAKGCRVMVGRCLPGAPTPYLPFQDALEGYLGGKLSGEAGGGTSRLQRVVESARRAAPEIVEAAPVIGNILKATAAFYKEYKGFDLSPQSESERTLHATLDFLRQISSRHGLLMVLDDLQWADSASIQLLHFLARNPEGLRLLLIGTYRPEELSVEAPDKISPLLDSLRIMRREGSCKEISLDRLSIEELGLAIEGMLNGRIQDQLLHRIASESGGNPLFALEIVRLLAQTRSIVPQNGLWKVSGQVRIDIPSTVKEVVLRRIDRLPTELRRLLEYASVIGEWFDPTILEETLHYNRLNLLETLDTIERNSQLIRVSDGLYHFSHETVRRTLYEEISVSRRKELHRIVATFLEGRLPDETLYGQLSDHFYKAGETVKCVNYSMLAGQSSLRRFAAGEAIAYFQRCVDAAQEDPSMLEANLQALEGLGDAHKIPGLLNSAISFYKKYLELSTNSKDRARVLRKLAYAGPLSSVAELLDQAERCGEIDPVEMGRIKVGRGQLAYSKGALKEARGFISGAEELFRKSNATEQLADANWLLSFLDLAEGNVKDALERAKRAEHLFSSFQSPGGLVAVSEMLGHVYLNLGLLKEARESYDKVIEIESKFGRYPAIAVNFVYKGWACILAHDFESVRQNAAKAYEYALRIETLHDQVLPLLMLAHAEIRLNRVTGGEKLFADALTIIKLLLTDQNMRSVVGREALYEGSGFRIYSIPAVLAYEHAVWAESLAAKEDWSASNEKWRQAIEFSRGGLHAPLLEASCRWYFGDSLMKQGLISEGKGQYEKVAEIAETLGNITLIEAMRSNLS